MNLEQEAQKLIKIKGKVRGAAIRANADYIRHKKGEKGLRCIEEKLKELGCPLDFKEIRALAWYPEALSVLVVLVAKELFGWTEKDIFEMGNSTPKYSFIVKILMEYFVSPRKSFRVSPKYWQRHYDFGELETHKFDEKEKYLVVRVRGYKFHPLMCIFHAGFFLRIAQYVIKSERITIKETKCVFKGAPYHEYVIRWK